MQTQHQEQLKTLRPQRSRLLPTHNVMAPPPQIAHTLQQMPPQMQPQ